MSTRKNSSVGHVRLGLVGAVAVALVAGFGTTAEASVAPGEPGKPVAPPVSSPRTPDPGAGGASGIDPDAAAAMAKQRGISLAEAHKRLGQEKAQGELAASIEKSLGGRSGGHYLDVNGQLVVATIDAAGDAAARRAGARAQRVDDSSARLDGIIDQLDRHAAEGGPGALQGWYVDVPSNSVVVTVTAGAKDARTVALRKVASAFGASVRIDAAPAEQAPETTEWIVGGYQYVPANGGTCSVGFNTRDGYGRNVVLSAGHCLKTAGTISRSGYAIGAVRTADYPGDDFGTFWNSYPTYWQPSTSVTKYNGTFVTVRGQWNAPPVGAYVCKSGRTTYYTCGTITALNQSVNYGGSVVYGMTRHNACVEPGDSGGSNISSGAYALGVTSGASLTAAKQCLSKVGQANVSWFQPIGEALTRNGLSLVYQP